MGHKLQVHISFKLPYSEAVLTSKSCLPACYQVFPAFLINISQAQTEYFSKKARKTRYSYLESQESWESMITSKLAKMFFIFFIHFEFSRNRANKQGCTSGQKSVGIIGKFLSLLLIFFHEAKLLMLRVCILAIFAF